LLVAYDGSPKAREALYLAAYIGTQHGVTIKVLTSQIDTGVDENILADARDYLEQYPVVAHYILSDSPIASEINTLCQENTIDLILIGGYARSVIVDVVLGSAVDQVLREITLPVLVCR
jgi:nucleotide-binding universal stress UspA family protein